MATLTIKNLPDEVYEALKASAAAHRRSIIAEATVLLERALGQRFVPEADVLARAQRLREQTPVRLDMTTLQTAI